MAPKPLQDPFTQAMVNLRSHLLKCYSCRAAMNGRDMEPPCALGWTLCVMVARTCTKLLEEKRHAVSTINGHVYACPDISVHGEAYALTARPLSVTGTQDELF
jgi:hypothetical protein